MNDATGGSQKTLAGLDDIAHEAGTLNFISWGKILCELLPPNSDVLAHALSRVAKVQHFLKTEYKKFHLMPTSRVAAHCIRHAFFLPTAKPPLSRFSGLECGEECHGHDLFCKHCDEVEEIREFLERSMLNFTKNKDSTAEKIEDLQFLVNRCVNKLNVLIGHLIRVHHESSYFNDAVANLPLDTALLQCDHKMKCLPKFFREQQVAYFAKKGITLIGAMFYYINELGQVSSKMFFCKQH